MTGGLDYFFYVDASGDTGRYTGGNTRYYTIIGLGLVADSRLRLEDEINQVLSSFFEEDIPKEINSRNLVNCKRSFAHFEKGKKRELVVELLNLLIKYEAVCEAVVVDKVIGKGTSPHQTWLNVGVCMC